MQLKNKHEILIMKPVKPVNEYKKNYRWNLILIKIHLEKILFFIFKLFRFKIFTFKINLKPTT